MSLDYDAMEAAFHDCAVAATGLPSAAVRWAYAAYQGVPRPVGQRFITMQLGPSVPVGIDGVDTDYDGTRAPGEEIEYKTVAPREFRWYLQCFGGTPNGNTSALATLQKLRERLPLTSVRAHLTGAGISPFAPGAIQYVPSIEGTKFESRATFECRCSVDASESEFCGFIAHVTLVDGIAVPTTIFTVDVPRSTFVV